MDNVVTQEVFKRIDAIAEKLGTTAQYMWPTLVKYEFGKSMGFSIMYCALVSAFIFGVYYSMKNWKDITNADLEGWVFGILFVLGAISIIGFFIFTLGIIPVLVSPEAAAFYKLVGK